ncbi:NosD domain-containing protein [Methanosarcina sp.]|uniref:NosD domain-containing protein n=1 Tax=Methanosarcina sp. TaxID=2213 RepID=UPI002ABAE5F1|nr:NosD domain-containing protein [Methanosarcina sp.]MDY9926804.1 NosD domain-containing protein [Methanosarcina sp.]
MRNRTIFLIILVFIFIISISATSSAREITVDDDSGADFRSIQEAVNNSVPGDTIIVRSGTYTENVLVNVTGLTIRSESNNSNAQVKPLNESKGTFWITADTITISGLNITGASKNRGKVAIFVYGKMNNVTGNTVKNGSIVLGSYMPDNLKIIFHGDMNNVTGNTIENGSIILGSEISGNLIAENKISNGEGIHISCCGRNNTVLGNTISNCSTGIYAYDQAVEIRNNRIANCNYGIRLSFVSSGIDNNTILNCDVGIHLGDGCLGAEIINNTIMSSAECGIVDQYNEGGKRIYNNYFNNTVNVRFGAGRENTWNNSLASGTNIAGGPYIGGNFWAKPDGTGFSQICVDLDGNGIGDLPYNIYENEFDYLPLVSQSSPQNSVISTANFTASVTNGPAPLVVKFTDLSKNAIVWNWDFDNDGISDYTEQNPVYVYRTQGNYTVNLTASNGLNTNSKLANISVEKRISSTWPFVYITGSRGTVYGIDTATGTVITKVKVGGAPKGIAVAPNGKTAYVADRWGVNVSVIDTSTNTVTDTVKVGYDPDGVAISPDGKKVYVANSGSNNVSVIDTNTNTVTATVPVGNWPEEIVISPDGKKVYVANHGNITAREDTVSVIDTATNMVTATVHVGSYPSGVAITPDGKKVYVANEGRYISVIDTATNIVTATVDVDNSPYEIVVNPTGTKVYVAGTKKGFAAGTDDGFVSAIDTSNNTIIATMDIVGGSPTGLAVTPDGKKVYVANSNTSGNNILSVIDTSNDTVSATVNIEISPGGLAIIPDPESVFPVANFSSNISEGFAPLSVQFTDSSENATGRNWDFGDGATSNEQNPAHTYLSPGNYTACLIVNNADSTDSRFTTITVLGNSSGADSDSSGGSSHSSGG